MATNAGGIPEIVLDKKNGLLTEIGDHKNLAKNLISINKNEFTPNFDSQFLLNFSSKAMAEKTLQLYKELVNINK